MSPKVSAPPAMATWIGTPYDARSLATVLDGAMLWSITDTRSASRTLAWPCDARLPARIRYVISANEALPMSPLIRSPLMMTSFGSIFEIAVSHEFVSLAAIPTPSSRVPELHRTPVPPASTPAEVVPPRIPISCHLAERRTAHRYGLTVEPRAVRVKGQAHRPARKDAREQSDGRPTSQDSAAA